MKRLKVSTHTHTCVCVCMCAQSCLTLCDPRDSSPPGSSVHGIFQARVLKWVVISYSRRSSQPRDRTHFSCISCIGRWFLYHWATWENPYIHTHIHTFCVIFGASLIAQLVKNLPAVQETLFWSLGQEDPLEKGMAIHSSILAWRIPWMEEFGGLQSTGSGRVGHDWATTLSLSLSPMQETRVRSLGWEDLLE